MQVKDLKPNKQNPRKMSAPKKAALKKSLIKFGDLSGFVFNRQNKSLVGGHQRTSTLPKDAKIVIEQKYDKPTKAKTVAEGYVIVDGERFKYREVEADDAWHTEAMLAANGHAGEWDEDKLKVIRADFPKLDWEVAGFDVPMPTIDIPAPTASLPSHSETSEGSDEDADAEHIKNTPQTTEQVPTESIGEAAAFDKVEEKTEVAGKRFVIIIDCGSQAKKDELREKIKAEVEMAGAKFF